MRKVKRQCRTFKISAERNTSARITDDIPLLKWILHSAIQFLNKIRTGRRWRQSMTQFGEEELISFVIRIIQGIFVGHHDRTRAIPYIANSKIVRGKSWTRQTLSDAWESTIREALFGNPWHRRLQMMVTETELATEVEPEIVAGKPPEVSVEDPTSCLRILKLTEMSEVVWDTRCLLCMEKRQNHVKMNSENNSERLLSGEARMEKRKERIAETQRVRERKRTRIERGAACACGTREHEEKRLRDIQVSKRG